MAVLIAAGVAGCAMLLGAFLYWRLRFFLRDPPRTVPDDCDEIVAAADGFVTYVKRIEMGEVPIAVKGKKAIPLVELSGLPADERTEGYLIGIYMTEHSVHRNRVPVSGTVTLREHRSAAPFNRSMARMTLNLLFGRRPYETGCNYLLQNERLTIGIRHACGALVTVTQIADLWVNRIVARVNVGDTVERGQQYGLIRFGSQCDVVLPAQMVEVILVEAGQYVWAGETVIARMPRRKS